MALKAGTSNAWNLREELSTSIPSPETTDVDRINLRATFVDLGSYVAQIDQIEDAAYS